MKCVLQTISASKAMYLSSPHDFLGFGVEVVISPQCLKQHVGADAHFLTVHLGKLVDAETERHGRHSCILSYLILSYLILALGSVALPPR